MNPPAPTDAAKPGLAGHLFTREDLAAFAILDGASVKDLVKNLYQHEPEFCCLYRGQLEPDTATVAPYLVRLEPDAEFTQWVLAEGWGLHWGVFLQSAANLRTLRNHFREFLKVELPDRRQVLFRFYDPRVLRCFLPACNPEELEKFFGPVQAFLLENDAPENGLRFSLAAQKLKTEPFLLKKTPG
jgi:hypothetical protein